MRRKTRRSIQFFLLCLAVALMEAPASARFVPQVAAQAEKDGTASLMVNGRVAVHLRTSNGNLSPADRAKIALGRLSALVENGFDPRALWKKQAGRDTHVMAGDSLLIIATGAEAHARGTTTAKLAESWIGNLRKLLSMPPLSVNPTSLLVPLGENRIATVESLLPSPISAEIANPSIIFVDAQTKPGSLIVMGISPGDTSITIRCGEYTASISVSVKKYAAYLAPGEAAAVVTGWNVPPSLISRAARDAARRRVMVEAGARVRSTESLAVAQDIHPGQAAQVPVQIEVAGGDYIPTKLVAPVRVENRSLPGVPTSWIMYSNDPERLLKYQMLFTGQLTSTYEATRLLYHHQNMMGRRIGFVIDVVNPSATTAALHVIEGVSKPMQDTVLVGYKAGMEFLESHRGNVGRVVELPAGTRTVIVSQPLDHQRTASGVIELRQLSGEPLIVRVIAKPEDQRYEEDILDSVIPAPGIDLSRIALSDHIYPEPLKNLSATYTAGKPWVFLRIGKHAIKNASQEKELYGNYGVIYDIRVTLENPLESPHTVELAFEATAGDVSGIFIVDGNLMGVKYLRPPSEATIGKVTIPPGRSRIVSIRTMPLSGSAYPATLIIRPTGTVGSARG